MNIHRIVLCTIALSLMPALSAGQNQSQGLPQNSTTAAESAKIDPAKAADIRRLLDLVGTKELMAQTLGGSMQGMKPLLMNSFPAGAYREKLIDLFIAKFQSNFNGDKFLDLAAVYYDKNLTHEEVKGLIQFYQTPLGQKTLSILPKLTSELREAGSKMGKEIGRRSIQEVLAEHPDLAAALEEASKAKAPQ
jgi:hypothetical protein